MTEIIFNNYSRAKLEELLGQITAVLCSEPETKVFKLAIRCEGQPEITEKK